MRVEVVVATFYGMVGMVVVGCMDNGVMSRIVCVGMFTMSIMAMWIVCFMRGGDGVCFTFVRVGMGMVVVVAVIIVAVAMTF